MSGLLSELLKYRRTFMGKLIIFIPVFFAVFAIVILIIMNNSSLAQASGNTSINWTSFLALVFNWWSFLFLPLGIALFSCLVTAQEEKSGNYFGLLSHNISPMKLWINKMIGMMIYLFLSTIMLIIVIFITGAFLVQGSAPVKDILEGALLCWLTSIVLIPIQLWIATWSNMLVSMGVGLFGMVIGVLLAPTKSWIFCPWSWATRLMSPVIGIHPNGTILNSGDYLLNSSVIPFGIVISISSSLLITFVSGFWFSRREAI